MLTKTLLFAAALGATLALATKVSYPHCASEDTSKCCALTTDESMAHHGYFLASIDGNATVVTCKAGALECHLGNPGQSATNGEYAEVACPDFSKIFESRSGLEVLEGVVYGDETAAVNGQVKPAAA